MRKQKGKLHCLLFPRICIVFELLIGVTITVWLATLNVASHTRQRLIDDLDETLMHPQTEETIEQPKFVNHLYLYKHSMAK